MTNAMGESAEIDVEAQAAPPVPTTEKGVIQDMLAGDGEVSWDEPDDPANPYNWSMSRKITTGLVCSTSQLITTMSASMVVPALDQILLDLHMRPFSGQIAFSVFFLGLGFAPFVVAPLSEIYGRRPVWLAGNVVYIIWNSLCPVGYSPALMVVGRLFSAFGASVGVALTSPILADMFGAKDRGKAVAIASLLPYIGPALGPIIGGLAARYLWWPWLFWILSICDLVGLTLGFFLIQETYGVVLLRRKGEKLRRESKPTRREAFQRSRKDFLRRFGPAVKRPVRLLLRRPVIQLIAIGLSVEFGVYTLVLGSFATLWQTEYHQSATIASLHYIAIAIGAFTCAQVGGRLMDFIWHRMKAARPNDEPTPEYRLPYALFGFVPAIVGLFWYGWAAEKHTHWVVVDLGIICHTLGSFMFAQALLAYLLDEFPRKLSASAGAATRLGTYVFGFGFPIFSPALYSRLGYGWGNSLLSFLFLFLGALVIFVLWFWGPQVRRLGRTEDEKDEVQT